MPCFDQIQIEQHNKSNINILFSQYIKLIQFSSLQQIVVHMKHQGSKKKAQQDQQHHIHVIRIVCHHMKLVETQKISKVEHQDHDHAV